MLPSRYYYFLMYLNLIVSMTVFTPQLMYAERYKSSLSSLFFALILTSVMLIVFESRMKRFRGEAITKIMNGVFSNTIQKALLLCHLLLSYWVGLIILVWFTQITHLLFPEMSTGFLYGVFVILVVFASLLDSTSILFMMEIVVLLEIPFALILLLIFGLEPKNNFDFIIEAATYIVNLPSYHMIAIGAFLFNGYSYLLVFNEHLELSNKNRRHLIVFAVGTVFLCSFYFIPISYFGLAGITPNLFVWFSTANSMNIRHFFIERYLLVFYMVQMGISLMFVIMCWHSSLKFLKQVAKRTDGGNGKWISLSLLVVASCIFWLFLDESKILNSFSWFLDIKLAFDLAVVGVIVWCAQKRNAA